MEIKDFDKQFVERTKYIIENSTSIESKYEITLLVNCLLALIVLPTERTSNISKDGTFKSVVVSKIKHMDVIQVPSDDNKLFRTIKNAISHMHIEIQNKNGKISEVVFRDKLPNSNCYHTILKFAPSQLKEFALFVADKHLERLSANKS